MAAEADNDTLHKELNQLRSDIAALKSTIKDLVAERSNAAYDGVRRTAKKTTEQASQAADAVGHEIAERPLTSVLGAFGIGLLIGVLFNRR